MDWLRVEICSAHTFPLNRLAGRQGAIEGRKYVHIWTGAQHTRRRGRHNLIIRLGPKSMDGSRYFTLAASERAGEHANPSLKAWVEFISHSLSLLSTRQYLVMHSSIVDAQAPQLCCTQDTPTPAWIFQPQFSFHFQPIVTSLAHNQEFRHSFLWRLGAFLFYCFGWNKVWFFCGR